MLSHSNQETSREGSIPKILPTIISRLPRSYFCTPQGRNDNPRGCKMSRWTLPSCYIWYWTVYSRLSRTSLVGGYRSGLVPKVCPWSLLSGSAANNHQPGLRCDANPNDLDAENARRRSHQKTEFLITSFDPGVLWDDFGVRSDVVVRLPISLWR